MDNNNLTAELKAMLDEKYLIVSARTWNSWPDSAIQSYEDYCAEIQAFRDTATDFYLAGQSSMNQGAGTDEEIKQIAWQWAEDGKGSGDKYFADCNFQAGMKHYRDTYATPSGQSDEYCGYCDGSGKVMGGLGPLRCSFCKGSGRETPSKVEGNEVDWDKVEEMILKEIFIKTGGDNKNPEIAKVCAAWLRTNLHKYLKK